MHKFPCGQWLPMDPFLNWWSILLQHTCFKFVSLQNGVESTKHLEETIENWCRWGKTAPRDIIKNFSLLPWCLDFHVAPRNHFQESALSRKTWLAGESTEADLILVAFHSVARVAFIGFTEHSNRPQKQDPSSSDDIIHFPSPYSASKSLPGALAPVYRFPRTELSQPKPRPTSGPQCTSAIYWSSMYSQRIQYLQVAVSWLAPSQNMEKKSEFGTLRMHPDGINARCCGGLTWEGQSGEGIRWQGDDTCHLTPCKFYGF